MYRLLLVSTESALSLENYAHASLILTFPAGYFYEVPRILPAERPKIHKLYHLYYLYQISNSPVKKNLSKISEFFENPVRGDSIQDAPPLNNDIRRL